MSKYGFEDRNSIPGRVKVFLIACVCGPAVGPSQRNRGVSLGVQMC
jgi:hypothetical protein